MNENSLLNDVIGLSCSEQNISRALRRSLCLPDSLLAKLHTFKYLHQSFIMLLYKLSFIRETFYVKRWKENCQQSMTLQWRLNCDAYSPWRRPISEREKKVSQFSSSCAMKSVQKNFKKRICPFLCNHYMSILVKTIILFYIYSYRVN